MGPATNRFVQVVISLLPPDLPITLITFACKSRTKVFRTQIRELHRVDVTANGMTYMSKVFPQLEKVVRSTEKPIVLVALSDGEVTDTSDTKIEGNNFQRFMNMKEGSVPLTSILLRLMNGGQGDTQALSHMAVASCESTIHDVILDRDPTTEEYQTVQTVLQQEFQEIGKQRMLSIKHTQSVLRQFPDESCKQCVILTEQTALLVTSSSDLTKLTFHGAPIGVTMSNFTNELSIYAYLQALDKRLRMFIVNGQCSNSIVQIKAFLTALIQAIEQHQTLVVVSSTSSLNKERLNAMVRKLKGTDTAFLLALRELDNQALKQMLQSKQMQANFARASTTPVSTQLAKRVAKAVPGFDFESAVIQEYHHLCSALIVDDDTPDPTCHSFLSLNTTFQNMQDLRELQANIDAMASLSLDEIMTMLGAVGLCFQAPMREYIDPFTFHVERVFVGGMYVSQNDLLHAPNAVRYPGTSEPVTGVVVLPTIVGPHVFKAYRECCKTVNGLHTSRSMRGKWAPVSGDSIAVTMAVLLCLVRQVGDRHPTSLELSIFRDLANQVLEEWSRYDSKDLISHLLTETTDLRRIFTGATMNISNETKPMAVALSLPPGTLSTARIRDIVCASFHLKVIRRLLHCDTAKRKEMIHCVLGIDLERSRQLSGLTPMFEVNGPYHGDLGIDFDGLKTRLLKQLDDLQLEDFAGYARFLVDPVTPPSDPWLILGLDPQLLQVGAVLEALIFCSEADRFSQDKPLGPTPGDATSIEDFAKTQANKIYLSDFHARNQEKRTDERENRAKHSIQFMVSCADMEEYLRYLDESGMESPSHSEFPTFKKGLLDLTSVCPLRCEKLMVVLSGRRLGGNIVWARGSFYDGKLARFAKVFESCNSMDLWQQFMDLREQFKGAMHVYHNAPNRHGHSKDKPSFCAWGYRTFAQFQQCVSAEVLAQYKEDHKGCCTL